MVRVVCVPANTAKRIASWVARTWLLTAEHWGPPKAAPSSELWPHGRPACLSPSPSRASGTVSHAQLCRSRGGNHQTSALLPMLSDLAWGHVLWAEGSFSSHKDTLDFFKLTFYYVHLQREPFPNLHTFTVEVGGL